VLAASVIVCFGVFLIGLAITAFVRPALARRFFDGFASSWQTHYGEQIVRLIVGIALVLHAEQMWLPIVFRVLGWLIIATAAGLMCIPWRWHQRFAQRVIPMVNRYLRAYAILIGVFGVLLIAAVVV